jgi:hypothetical protein
MNLFKRVIVAIVLTGVFVTFNPAQTRLVPNRITLKNGKSFNLNLPSNLRLFRLPKA